MRFDFDAYSKVFPEAQTSAVIESAVDTFHPTSEKAKDEKPGDEMKATPEPEPEPVSDQIVTPEPLPANEPKGDQNE